MVRKCHTSQTTSSNLAETFFFPTDHCESDVTVFFLCVRQFVKSHSVNFLKNIDQPFINTTLPQYCLTCLLAAQGSNEMLAFACICDFIHFQIPALILDMPGN